MAGVTAAQPVGRAITATDTLLGTDSGSVIWASPTSAASITVPAGLPAGYNARLVWLAGSGRPSFVAGSGVTLTSAAGTFGVAAAKGDIVIRQTPTANTFLITGATA